MDKKDIDFQKRIRVTFRIEAEEHIGAISANLTELKNSRSTEKGAEIIEVIFREVHSLKGAARSIDEKDIENVCQPLESIFSVLKRREISLSPQLFDIFFRTVEWLSKLLFNMGREQSGDMRRTQQEIIQKLKDIVAEKASPLSAPKSDLRADNPHYNMTAQIGMVRIPVSKLDPLLLQAEEMIQSKITLDQRITELKSLHSELKEWKTESHQFKSRRSGIKTDIRNEWDETIEMRLNNAESQLATFTRSMEHDQRSLDRLVYFHLDSMKQVLMLPVSMMVETFPGMVREISREQNKEIDFKIRGTELEIDKRILEELKDPLIHLIRNSISHGIGNPQERLQMNKPPRANITLSFTAKESRYIEITLSDDGKGIDSEQLLKSAIGSGIISEQEAGMLGPDDILNLIFQSGVSTSPVITDISGRGLGLTIVQEKVMKLKGKISVETEKNKGTTFRILLPMTLATFRGVLVKVNEFMFIIPTMNVEMVMKVEKDNIKTIENHETICINEQVIPVADLCETLGLSENRTTAREKIKPDPIDPDSIRLVFLDSGDNRIAFRVDEVEGEQQVLVKSLGKLLKRVKNISGVTILGSGNVVPVLNVPDLLKSAVLIKEVSKRDPINKLSVFKTGRILVAEDSITSRTLLKNILETAGYKIITSINGADAYLKARTGNFDLVVSDVDMPEMNGFELTMKIKGDKDLEEIPVILLTALESRDDREKGIEAGADAYIVKSSFDQGNLLEVIKKLI